MANTLTAFNEAFWAAQMQVIFEKELVALPLANTDQREILHSGDTLHKPYRSHLYVKTYTKGTDVTVEDVAATDEYLTVNTAKIVPFYIDDIDALENKWDTAARFAQDAQRRLNAVLDQTVLAEYSNATSTILNSDMGGSGSTAFSLNTANVADMFTVAARKMDYLDIPQSPRFAVIGPRTLEILRQYVSGRETSYGDIVGANGKVTERFGFEIYYSNNCPFTSTWTPANNPSNTDTVSIAGVTLTFKTTPASAGDILIGGTTAVTLDNLVACINQTGTAGTDYIVLADANRWKIEKNGVVATDGTTVMTIVGYGDVVVAASETNDPWSVQIQHSLFGLKGATDFVIQKYPNVVFKDDPDRLGKNVFAWMLYGKLTFIDMKDALVDARINASAWA